LSDDSFRSPEITAGASPYSKSHNRRAKRAARPSENLVTNLTEVEDVLEQLRVQAEEEEEEQVQAAEKVVLGGKGQEKLTAKKRQRVLCGFFLFVRCRSLLRYG
jgi:hypothetical protein